MKKRHDRLVSVRAAASRMASAAFADASAHLTGQQALDERLQSATAALSPEIGVATGAGLASQLELGCRMAAARRMTQARVEDAKADLEKLAAARIAARRACDAAVEIGRSREKAAGRQAETRVIPAKPSQVMV